MADASLRVALGDRRYEVDRDFYTHSGPGSVSDVAVGPDGLVHVLIRHDPSLRQPYDAVITLDSEARVLGRWGGEIIADSHMLSAAPDGRLFIVDRDAHEIVICEGEARLGGIGKRHAPLEPFNHPTAVAFCPRGTIYVSDGYANHKIHRFSPTAEPLGSWGAFGTGPGEFINPHALWVLKDGRVVVVDRENDRLQVFSADGVLIDIWTGFIKPLDVWADADDRLYVTDLVPSLALLASDGTRLGRCRPVLNGAHGVSGDARGNLYLAEPSPSRVTRLVPIA
ncbi:MAG: hypothetical protein AB7S80_03955 [Rhizobiaceae bacterium]